MHNQREPRSWHDYVAGVFYLVGSTIELLLGYCLWIFWERHLFEALSPEFQGFYALMFFLGFWAGITQFVIGWLVAHAKRDTLLEHKEVSDSKKVSVSKPISTIIRTALIIVTVFLAILLVFALIQYVHANPLPF